MVQGPAQKAFAVVIKLNSGDGAVRFFQGSKDLGDRQTGPKEKERVVMIVMEAGQSCWLLGNALVKFISCAT